MAYSTIYLADLDLKDCIGTGGFSTVYRALWMQREVTVKRSSRPHEREKDRQEAESISRLNHPNIVKLFGVAEDHLDFYLILEFCDGGTLRSYLDAHRGMPLGVLFYDWAEQAGNPLEYLRKNKIVHKDVKSPNYLISNGNILKLADFGLAKNTDVTISRATETASYPWMAPELLRDQILSPNYDIYAYEL